MDYKIYVAPFAGAWIEIVSDERLKEILASLPSRERGLKFCNVQLASNKTGRSLRGSVD